MAPPARAASERRSPGLCQVSLEPPCFERLRGRDSEADTLPTQSRRLLLKIVGCVQPASGPRFSVEDDEEDRKVALQPGLARFGRYRNDEVTRAIRPTSFSGFHLTAKMKRGASSLDKDYAIQILSVVAADDVCCPAPSFQDELYACAADVTNDVRFWAGRARARRPGGTSFR
jgi:hypothetical protein